MRRPRGLLPLAVGLLLAGCSGAGEGGGGGQGAPRESEGVTPSSADGAACAQPTSAPAASAAPGGSSEPTPGEGEFDNPVIPVNMPDPYVLDAEDRYYLYSTASAGCTYPYATSADLVSWELRGDAMPQPPAWANGNFWAPEVTRTPGGYVMYFTARAAGVTRPDGKEAQCVGVAVSQTPDGPFTSNTDAPLVCQADLGGTIDASVVRDVDDALWLIYKNDGNCCRIETRFFMRKMSEDGLEFAGEEIAIEGIKADRRWEGNVVEAPTIRREGDTYYLFYSANAYDSAFYSVGYATSETLTGPYEEAQENPILESGRGGGPIGPGHQALVEDRDGDLWMVYHSWRGFPLTEREVWIDEVVFEDGKAVVKGPDPGPQPAP